MMWYKDLYVGSLASFLRDSIIEAVDRGDYPPGVYVIMQPVSGSSQLEILAANELRHKWMRENCRMIVAVAMGRTEAQSMLEAIVRDVYADRGDADIRAFLAQKE